MYRILSFIYSQNSDYKNSFEHEKQKQILSDILEMID
jgi:hypothetical protein